MYAGKSSVFIIYFLLSAYYDIVMLETMELTSISMIKILAVIICLAEVPNNQYEYAL